MSEYNITENKKRVWGLHTVAHPAREEGEERRLADNKMECSYGGFSWILVVGSQATALCVTKAIDYHHIKITLIKGNLGFV